jgi:hypothetical protein
MRASDAAVSAVSELEKNADATIKTPTVSANSQRLDSIAASLQHRGHNLFRHFSMHKGIANRPRQDEMHDAIACFFIVFHMRQQNLGTGIAGWQAFLAGWQTAMAEMMFAPVGILLRA